MARTRPALLLAALVLAACGGDDEPAEEPAAAENGCRDVPAAEERPEGSLSPPEDLLDPAAEHLVRVETNCGAFTIGLVPEASPNAAASFAALVRAGFFDGTAVHRVVPGFVIQGGDPTGTGGGGPGYTTVDPPDPATTYTRGTVAMAKTAADPPGTAGSQYFVVTVPDAGLPPEYAVIGAVTEGMDAIERIEALGAPGTEQPSRPVAVERMTLDSG